MTDDMLPDQETNNDSPLSMSEAIAAYTAPPAQTNTEEEADPGQSDTEEAATGNEAEDEVSDEETTDEGETEDEGQADEEETDDEPDSEEGRFVASNGKVKLPDGTVATVNDLIQGNLRDRDYRQKTMAHAEEVKAFRAQSEAFQQRAQVIDQQREQMIEIINSIVPPEPDPSMIQTDPVTYMSQKASRDAWMKHIERLDAEKRQAAEQSQAEIAASREQKSVQEFQTLVEKVPVLKDQAKFTAFVNDVRTIGAEYGFTPQELVNGIGYDHRMAMVMRDAIAMRKIQKAKPRVQAKTEARPPVQRGSKRVGPAEQKARQVNAAIQRLDQSGKLSDGVAALLAMERKG